MTPTIDTTFTQIRDLVSASPTAFHAAEEVARQLTLAGFTRLEETDEWHLAAGGYVVVRDGAVIAWVLPEHGAAAAPVHLVGAHTDSPGFRLKPSPASAREGWQTVGVEVYGGPLLNSWLDRDLRVGARLALADGSTVLAHTADGVARIPQLAVHLDRGVNADGVKLDRQQHTRPIVGLDTAGQLVDALAASASVDPAAVVALDGFVVDAQAPARIGLESNLLASGRLDNLVSVHAGLRALMSATNPQGAIPMLAAFDHEEVGSASRTGAAGPFLEDVLARIRAGLGAEVETVKRANAASWSISSDVGHAVHPNYPSHHDDEVRPHAGRGPILKINADQRYTTDAAGEALWHGLSTRAGVPVQRFVSRNSIPSGSTIGPISATRLGFRTVDVGIPILSMHSARELASLEDVLGLERVLREFLGQS
ncbi:M18 family aminopeptidase [Gulosibacter sediminis]|uniref:M18 family aminopeptidase n=1 Tax=Gulosibacter sediminis TaxID=1729695 RepID=UPI0024A95525|nr:M18 family aminopeptidase [Gulosibacter sediminis]